MSLKDDINKVQNKVEELENQSFAMELIHDYKMQNKRLFIIWIITFIAFISLLGYTIWLLNDIGTVEEVTTVTQDNDNGYNNYIGNDGDINYGKAND